MPRSARTRVVLAAMIVVLGIWPLTAAATPCKLAGESCRMTQRCCTGVCVKVAGSLDVLHPTPFRRSGLNRRTQCRED